MHPERQHIYFEKQGYFSSECGVCALNNLLGNQVFKSKDLTQICQGLSTDLVNPYKSVLGGDYDVTVLILALQQIGFPVRWLKNSEKIGDILDHTFLKGLLINTEQKSFGTALKKLVKQSGRHWTCLKKIGDHYVLLDSLQAQPLFFKHRDQAELLLESARMEGGTILVIELQHPDPSSKQQTNSQK